MTDSPEPGRTVHETVFSEDRKYRYRLVDPELGSGEGTCLFILLNPSTADEERSDPTVTRCKGFARGWGYRRLIVANLFAFRSTDRSVLKRVADPVGPENDRYILQAARESDVVIAAWGADGSILERGRCVYSRLTDERIPMLCLAKNVNGEPKHPLYVRRSTTPSRFQYDVD